MDHLPFLTEQLNISTDVVREHLNGNTNLVLILVGVIYGLAADASPVEIVNLFTTPSVMLSFLESFLEEDLAPSLDGQVETLLSFVLTELIAYNSLANKIRELAQTDPSTFGSLVTLLCKN
tara:strand:- start:420 stop:782 length:363 start_codon:yes stop_codon:yes gene_type:complete